MLIEHIPINVFFSFGRLFFVNIYSDETIQRVFNFISKEILYDKMLNISFIKKKEKESSMR